MLSLFAGGTPSAHAQDLGNVVHLEGDGALEVPELSATYKLTYTGDPGANANLTVTYANGTATGGPSCGEGVDFVNTSRTQSNALMSGTTPTELDLIQVCADRTEEGDETLTATITASQNVFDHTRPYCTSRMECTVTVTIKDEDKPTIVPNSWTLKPTGIGPGQQFRLLFISSTQRDAASTDINDYNHFVQGVAANGHTDIRAHALGFRALGCTSTVDATANAGLRGPGVPIYYLNGAKLAENYSGLNTFVEKDSGRTESGAAITTTFASSTSYSAIWSGCEPSGAKDSQQMTYLGGTRTIGAVVKAVVTAWPGVTNRALGRGLRALAD